MPRPARRASGLSEDRDLFALTGPTEGSAIAAEGHRSRMRHRLISAGAGAVADHAMLERVLFLALPRRDTKPLARALSGQFCGCDRCATDGADQHRRAGGGGDRGADAGAGRGPAAGAPR